MVIPSSPREIESTRAPSFAIANTSPPGAQKRTDRSLNADHALNGPVRRSEAIAGRCVRTVLDVTFDEHDYQVRPS
ncbi:hypothetical protein [Halostagnicola larsenii]|uniref:hypothetical protein n=1 Tax=Halostagnicola larsenii TaxID=353800 RepID=UPI00146FC4C7|nr:hypothetical protein [Halostagnicola larsenii]